MIYWARPKAGPRCCAASDDQQAVPTTLAAAEHHDIRWCSAADLDTLQPPMSGAVKSGISSRRHPRNFRPIIMNKARRLKTICFTLEGLSSFATSLNSYYLYFYPPHVRLTSTKEQLKIEACHPCFSIFESV